MCLSREVLLACVRACVGCVVGCFVGEKFRVRRSGCYAMNVIGKIVTFVIFEKRRGENGNVEDYYSCMSNGPREPYRGRYAKLFHVDQTHNY